MVLSVFMPCWRHDADNRISNPLWRPRKSGRPNAAVQERANLPSVPATVMEQSKTSQAMLCSCFARTSKSSAVRIRSEFLLCDLNVAAPRLIDLPTTAWITAFRSFRSSAASWRTFRI